MLDTDDYQRRINEHVWGVQEEIDTLTEEVIAHKMKYQMLAWRAQEAVRWMERTGQDQKCRVYEPLKEALNDVRGV